MHKSTVECKTVLSACSIVYIVTTVCHSTQDS